MTHLGVSYSIILLATFAVVTFSRLTCSNEKCVLCKSTGCSVTCNGYDCDTCPRGNCCNGGNCNVCINSHCCEDSKCNSCVRKCSRKCPINRFNDKMVCRKKCSQMCLNVTNSTQKTNITNTNNNSYNVTTIIKLYNILNNTNVIDTPVNINVTNLNNITVNPEDLPNVFNSPGEKRNTCCYITHPEECPTGDVCFRRKHVECSYLCTSPFILIKHDPTANNSCIPVAVYPHKYCGKYITEDCRGCYNCQAQNCLHSPSCSTTCKASILPEKYYNTPYKKQI